MTYYVYEVQGADGARRGWRAVWDKPLTESELAEVQATLPGDVRVVQVNNTSPGQVVVRSTDVRRWPNTAVPLVWEKDGLGVHETIRLNSNAPVLWSVTHVQSGAALVRAARSREKAVQLAEALLKLADWRRPRDSLRNEEGLSDRVRAVLRD